MSKIKITKTEKSQRHNDTIHELILKEHLAIGELKRQKREIDLKIDAHIEKIGKLRLKMKYV